MTTSLRTSICVAACLTACTSNPQVAILTQKSDKYVGVNILTAGPIELSKALTSNFVRATEPGKSESASAIEFTHNGAYHAQSSSWQYLNNHRLYLLIDGKSYDLGTGSHKGNVIRSGAGGVYVLEEMRFFLKTLHLDSIRQAKSIGGRLGPTEFVFNDQQLRVVKDFAGRPSE